MPRPLQVVRELRARLQALLTRVLTERAEQRSRGAASRRAEPHR
jgi:hypothetical protein